MLNESPPFSFLGSALLECLQECQQLLWRTIPATPTPKRLSFGESLFLQFKAGVKVYLSGVH
jgi:hypothetical protein